MVLQPLFRIEHGVRGHRYRLAGLLEVPLKPAVSAPEFRDGKRTED